MSIASGPRHQDPSHGVRDAPFREDLARPDDAQLPDESEGEGEDEDEDSLAPPLSRTPSSPPLVDVDLPQSELDLTMTFESILAESSRASNPEVEIVQKRASNVLKLTQENEKLKAELRAMTERLEAAERRQRELRQKVGRPGEGSAT
ncbi:hypothetical protein BKA93DRAFT_828998 [Sparassis latifolia]